jgi:hypothetical protein
MINLEIAREHARDLRREAEREAGLTDRARTLAVRLGR